MKKYNPAASPYIMPKTYILQIDAQDCCIGFGEGSILPEESDVGIGWIDEDTEDDCTPPTTAPGLWEPFE